MIKHWSLLSHVLFFLATITATWSISCKFDIEMSQELLGKGFHRNLTYTIDILNEWPVALDGSCVLSLEQPVPAGLYANPDELFEMNQAGKLVAQVRERVDVELSAETASPATVLMMQLLDAPRLALWMPLHARYHKAVSGGGDALVRVPAAKLFISCQPKEVLAECMTAATEHSSGHCSRGALCRWIPLLSTLKSEEVVWPVPVGNLNHGQLVSLLTAAAYFLCTFFVVRALHNYKRQKPHQK